MPCTVRFRRCTKDVTVIEVAIMVEIVIMLVTAMLNTMMTLGKR